MIILSNDYPSSVPGSGFKVEGGPARFTKDFSNFLVENGHKWVGIILQSEKDDFIKKVFTDSKKDFYYINTNKTSLENLVTLSESDTPEVFLADEIDKLVVFFKEIKPDLFFLNGFSFYAWMFFYAAIQAGIPVVAKHSGVFVKEIDAYKHLFTDTARNLCIEMEKSTGEKAQANIFLNNHSIKYFKEETGLDKINNPIVIPLSYPDCNFPKDEFINDKIDKKEKVFGVVARWDKIKNHGAILALAKEIKNQNLPWKIRAVTRIPNTSKDKEFKDEYKDFIEVLPLMSRGQLNDFYKTLDFLLLPSHFETAGTVVMESLSVGVPTIISPHVGWVDEYNKFKMHDWIMDFSDPKKVIDNIKNIINIEKWTEVGEFAKYVKKCHNPQVVYNSYLDVFSKVAISKSV